MEYGASSGALGGDGILSAGEAESSEPRSWSLAVDGSGPVTLDLSVEAIVPDAGGVTVSLDGLSAGRTHTCGIDGAGRAYCWGGNKVGQLGDSTRTARTTPVPVHQRAGGGVSFVEISAGARHTCGLDSSGQALCWGNGPFTGDGSVWSNRGVPSAVDQSMDGGVRFAGISAGANHACGLTEGGRAYCWGHNGYGQLGDGTNEQRTAPVAVDQSVDGGVRFAEIRAGLGPGIPHTCGLTEDGRAYCWGYNSFGQLGDGTTENRSRPVAVDQGVDGGVRFVEIATAGATTCGLTRDGRAYCWGRWGHGDEGPTRATIPTAVDQSVDGGVRFSEISTGGRRVCGLSEAGRLYCWGLNSHGALGDGTTADRRPEPTPVAGDLTFTRVSAGVEHTCALTESWAAYCWGNNESGQLGDGSRQERRTPAAVASTR